VPRIYGGWVCGCECDPRFHAKNWRFMIAKDLAPISGIKPFVITESVGVAQKEWLAEA